MADLGHFMTARVGIFAIGFVLAGAANAADLPTTKSAPTPFQANCFSSLWTYLNSSAAECPLSYAGFTVYATIDAGLGYSSNGAPASGTYSNSVYSFVGKQSYGAKWLWTPNGISQSVVGINMKEAIPWLPGWSLVGAVETGFSPYSGNLVNGPRSLVQNNGVAQVLQTANSDSSRAGQFDNSIGYIGLSNQTFGTLTVGRVTSLTLDGVIAYDPMSGSYAFSALGYSGSYAGFGDTETNRANTGVKYRVSYENLHAGALVQWGGYAQGNGTTGLYQGDVGYDVTNLFGGLLSVDAVGSYAQNAVSLSNFTGSCATFTKGALKGETGCSNGIPNFYGPDDLKATLSNNSGFELLAKYKWGPVTLSGGWMWWQQANPSDDYLNGFQALGGYSVPATIVTSNKAIAKLFPTAWTNTTAYNKTRVVNVPFIGAKYAINERLDVTGAFYYENQNNYNSSTTPCAYAKTSFVQANGNVLNVVRANSNACAGTQYAISGMIDYRPLKRLDLYAGLMFSNVYGGLANGFLATQNIAPTAGLRVKF
jgi:predicted porin